MHDVVSFVKENTKRIVYKRGREMSRRQFGREVIRCVSMFVVGRFCLDTA